MNIDLSPLNNLTNSSSFGRSYHIIDETDDYIVVCKSNGLAVQATDRATEDLERILSARLKNKIYVLNRIDQPVSGLVIFGKNRPFASAFTEMLRQRQVKKTYLALVSGEPQKGPVELRHYIRKLKNRAMTSDEKLDDNYKKAILVYECIQSFDRYHLLKVDLKTGRFHQIRAQLATAEMPIKGDIKYGARRPNIDRSIGLLSYQLEFIHPFTSEKLIYTSPLPNNDTLWGLVELA